MRKRVKVKPVDLDLLPAVMAVCPALEVQVSHLHILDYFSVFFLLLLKALDQGQLAVKGSSNRMLPRF